MPAAYRHPVHFTSPVNKNYQTNYAAINFTKKLMADEIENTNATFNETPAATAKRRGRPKGSKNKPKVPVAASVTAPGAPPAAGAPVSTVQHPVVHPDHAVAATGKTVLKVVDVPGTSAPAASTSANPVAGSAVSSPTAVVRVPVPETPEEKQERLQEEADEELARAEAKADADEQLAKDTLAARQKHAQVQADAVKPKHAHKPEPKDED